MKYLRIFEHFMPLSVAKVNFFALLCDIKGIFEGRRNKRELDKMFERNVKLFDFYLVVT